MKISLNPDKELVEYIKIRLNNSGGYCPCRIVHNDDTKCMCKEFREQTTPGMCHCGLYIKE